MDIFTINDNEVKTGDVRGIERDKRWAYLPAIEWRDDKAVNNVLPKHQPYYSPRGWFEVEDGWLRQILRDPYDRGPYTMDVYLLQNSTQYALGRILSVDAVMASFTIEQFATRLTVEAVRGLLGHQAYRSEKELWTQSIQAAHNLEQKGSCHLVFSHYNLLIETKDVDWNRLAHLINQIPHGNGWNGIWHITVRTPTRYDISIEYDASEGIDGSEVYYVGWDLTFAAGEWKVNDFRGDWYGEEEVDFNFQMFIENRELEVEEALNNV